MNAVPHLVLSVPVFLHSGTARNEIYMKHNFKLVLNILMSHEANNSETVICFLGNVGYFQPVEPADELNPCPDCASIKEELRKQLLGIKSEISGLNNVIQKYE